MRKTQVILLAAVLWGVGVRSASAGSIAGTPHDLSGKGWGTTETCKFCHTPHAAQAVTGAPLWNHQTTVASYTLYTSDSFKGGSTITQPGPTSKLCLSCHDGTVAVDSFATGGVVGTGSHFMASTNIVGQAGKLGTEHPISFNYDAALVALDSGLATPASSSYVDAGRTIPLYNSKLECASCHSVHDNTFTKFLRVSNAGSAMCLKCHLK